MIGKTRRTVFGEPEYGRLGLVYKVSSLETEVYLLKQDIEALLTILGLERTVGVPTPPPRFRKVMEVKNAV